MKVPGGLRRTAERALRTLVVPTFRRSGTLQKLLRYLVQEVPVSLSFAHARQLRYAQLREAFLANGKRSPYGSSERARLIEAFERVDMAGFSRTTPSDGLFLAEAALSLQCAGDFVECGCCEGASTAKLSLLASITSRRLHVFDSFEGLPDAPPSQRRDYDLRQSGEARWHAGVYGGGVKLVQDNVTAHGDLSVCRFYPGWFADTLASTAPEHVALAFVDVDLVGSVRDCVIALWPRLSAGGVLFSHDVSFLKVLRLFSDVGFWQTEVKAAPPILFGGGFGLCDDAPHLGFLVKDRETDADYVANLLLYKGLPGGV